MRRARLLIAPLAGAVFALGVGASEARPARSGQVTISMLATYLYKPGYDVLVPNFERVYPNITVNMTYATPADISQLMATELEAGNAPDLYETSPGCGALRSVCVLARSGYLAPMRNKAWVRWTLPLVTSLDKYGQGLFAFSPTGSPQGVFTNDALFVRLGLKMPQTFSQMLDLCQKAKAIGTTAVIFQGASGASVGSLIEDLAVATVYGKNRRWTTELKAGKVSFDGSPGWHQALQEFIDMSDSGCFQPGAAGTSTASAETAFANGQGMMLVGESIFKGTIDAANPQFAYSFHPFPGGSEPSQTSTFLKFGTGLSINAHSSAQNQAAAQTFLDFIARPKQNALYAETVGGLTQYEFLKGQIPPFMSSFATVFKDHEYVVAPDESWWNGNVGLALSQDGIGLLTGQLTIDDVLNAMDAAWRQGPQ
jgi:raffinose/stachyose/melibiose transport system substrate-binding protein